MARKLAVTAQAGRPILLGLLAECKANPFEDMPRLILADWLEEHGDEAERARGELIRIDCERQRTQETGWSVAAERAQELRRKYGKVWLGPLDGLLQQGKATLHRGLYHLRVHGSQFLWQVTANLAREEAYAWVEGLELDGERLRDALHDRFSRVGIEVAQG